MKTVEAIIDQDIKALEKMKKMVSSSSAKRNIGKDPLRGILKHLDIPDSLVDEAIAEFNKVAIKDYYPELSPQVKAK